MIGKRGLLAQRATLEEAGVNGRAKKSHIEHAQAQLCETFVQASHLSCGIAAKLSETK